MPTSYADRAKLFEQRASSKYNKARYASRPDLKEAFLREAHQLYDDAIREWKEEAISSKGYPRKIKYAHLNSINDKELTEKIQRQLQSVEKGGLEKRFIFAIASIISLVGALLSVSFNLTGYAIGALSYEKISLTGIIFFVLGLVFTFLFVRSKSR